MTFSGQMQKHIYINVTLQNERIGFVLILKQLRYNFKKRSVYNENQQGAYQGSTSMLVMSVLKGKDLYGYKIIKELELQSESVFELKEGTLYPILHALEEETSSKATGRNVTEESASITASHARAKNSSPKTAGVEGVLKVG